MPWNVKDFGAAGNGPSDGTAAINAAISIAASQNGGVGIATIAAGLVSRSNENERSLGIAGVAF
jgi:polygalacturonase